jgi:hypothetical protein
VIRDVAGTEKLEWDVANTDIGWTRDVVSKTGGIRKCCIYR